ncbi:hypothetical protein M3Y97_00897500 [Aphelenchoides bicaudatus]|nr:hypothetical protein M3Y97_00897500 [Aphelenchoides bicaudatus]
MARVVVIRDDGDYQVPEGFLSSRHGGHIKTPISRRSVETREPVDLRIATSFLKRGVKKHTVPEFTSRLDDKWHHHSDTVVMKINFNGYPMPTIQWFKDQRPIYAEMRHMVFNFVIHNSDYSTELVIFDAQKEDAGFYKCQIENDMGVRETTCQVYIGDTGRLVSKNGKMLSGNYRSYRSALYTPGFTYSRFPSTWL